MQTFFPRAATGRLLRTGVLALTVPPCLFVLCNAAAYAQAREGLNVTVLDAPGAVIPNAHVTLTNEQTEGFKKRSPRAQAPLQ